MNGDECYFTYAWTDDEHTYTGQVLHGCSPVYQRDEYGYNTHVVQAASSLEGCYFESAPEKFIMYG